MCHTVQSPQDDHDTFSLMQVFHTSKNRVRELPSLSLDTQKRSLVALTPADMTPQLRNDTISALYPDSPSSGSATPRTDCRVCKSYNSVIRLHEGLIPAGVLDRLLNLRMWSQLAASLCARLVLPPACKMLSKSLVGHPLPDDLPWSHFVTVKLKSDGSDILNPPDDVGMSGNSSTRAVISENQGEVNEATAMGTPKQRLDTLVYDEGPFKRAKAAYLLGAKYAQAEQKVDDGEAFQWDLYEDWLFMDWVGMLPKIGHCPLVSMEPSPSIVTAAQRFFYALQVQPGSYVTLHIRRRDAALACDTSIPKVVDYVKCSLDQVGWLNRTDQPLIVFTDEQDPTYLDDLLNALYKTFNSQRSVFLGDSAIHSVSCYHDGPFVFATSLYIRHQAAAEMFMDRTQCQACGLCRAPCRGYSFDEYVVQTELATTSAAAHIAGNVLRKNPPVSSCSGQNRSQSELVCQYGSPVPTPRRSEPPPSPPPPYPAHPVVHSEQQIEQGNKTSVLHAPSPPPPPPASMSSSSHPVMQAEQQIAGSSQPSAPLASSIVLPPASSLAPSLGPSPVQKNEEQNEVTDGVM